DEFALRQKIGKAINDGFDEYYRLEALGYRLIAPSEILPEGDNHD
ncbi:hypothetical protein LCGC14_2594120, partial [marine sediment metagenome]